MDHKQRAGSKDRKNVNGLGVDGKKDAGRGGKGPAFCRNRKDEERRKISEVGAWVVVVVVVVVVGVVVELKKYGPMTSLFPYWPNDPASLSLSLARSCSRK